MVDLPSGKLSRQRVEIELRVGPRPWETADIDHDLDPAYPQQLDEFGNCQGRMANRVNGQRLARRIRDREKAGGQSTIR